MKVAQRDWETKVDGAVDVLEQTFESLVVTVAGMVHVLTDGVSGERDVWSRDGEILELAGELVEECWIGVCLIVLWATLLSTYGCHGGFAILETCMVN